MPVDSSSVLNLSRVQNAEIDSSINVKSNQGMPADDRDSIAFRLRLLPDVLNVPVRELYEAAGLGKTGWSNVVRQNGKDRITVDAALDLWSAYGVSVEWIFKGDHNTILDPKLRADLYKAEVSARRRVA